MREVIKRTKHVGVPDMKKVKKLIDLRDKRNLELEGTKHYCNLYPNVNKKACQECSEKNRDMCLKHEWERDYIHKHEAKDGNKRRERKQDNPKHDILEISVKTSDDEEYDEMYEKYDVDEETPEIIEVDSEDDKYPCHAMNFTCPNRKECDFGKKCNFGKKM